MLGSKIYRTFPTLFPPPKSDPVDLTVEASSRMAAERRLLYPDFNYTMRNIFHTRGCTIYGFPSSGGIFIKENADIVDMNVLSLDCFHPIQRSPDPIVEDEFVLRCEKSGQSGEEGYIIARGNGLLQSMEHLLQRDFETIKMAVIMDERLEVMRDFGVVFYDKEEEDVEELGDEYWNARDDECL
ncbi:hypothetical protein OCU04_003558 [Sclerotinia nivalis]|uniref:Uncharacterized protein n=1 Tax=Sclerotinia nivalis TaxID=352851 RepID=A0A9X0AVN4_9HELO|nr:hypothetical protein OCU04_003558 [Sclerotinia nivalis]